jgi:hypothetical protein
MNEKIIKFIEIFENLKGSENIGDFSIDGEMIMNASQLHGAESFLRRQTTELVKKTVHHWILCRSIFPSDCPPKCLYAFL